jgi:hypothetical protein
MKEEELIPGIELIHSNEVAEMFLRFREEEQLILTL